MIFNDMFKQGERHKLFVICQHCGKETKVQKRTCAHCGKPIYGAGSEAKDESRENKI